MNYYVVFLLRPPDLLRREPLFEGTNVCNSQENGVRTRRAAIVNHYAIVDLLRRANLLRRSIFSTAGSFGIIYLQTGISPEFRATWLSHREKKGHFQPFSAYFPVFWGKKKGRKKPALSPGTRVTECTKIARFSAVAAAIFTAPPQNRAIFKAPRCAISSAKKSLANGDFICD